VSEGAGRCPVCKDPLAWRGSWEGKDHFPIGYAFRCNRCGTYLLSEEFHDRCRELRDAERASWWFRLSSWIRQQNSMGNRRPEIDGDPGEFIAALPSKTVGEQLDLLLHFVDQQAVRPGRVVRINPLADAVHVWAENQAEVAFLLDSLVEMRRLRLAPPYASHMEYCDVLLTAAGYLHLETLAASTANNRQVFVAMWFDQSMDAAWSKGLEPGIRRAGFDPFRIDQKPHGERIDAKILVEIRRSRAVIADATGQRPSVMFEAGFAEGLGKPVIWTCQADEEAKMPFDTRQLQHVLWKCPDDLADQLEPVIKHRLAQRS